MALCRPPSDSLSMRPRRATDFHAGTALIVEDVPIVILATGSHRLRIAFPSLRRVMVRLEKSSPQKSPGSAWFGG